MELANKLKRSKLPLLLINQELFGRRSFNPQPKLLLADIRNYTESFRLTQQLYQKIYSITSPALSASDDWHHWLANDIYGWANDEEPTMNGYTAKMYNLWKAFVPFWCDNMHAARYYNIIPSGRRPLNHYKIDCFLSTYLDNKTSLQQIRRFWGAMTPADRKNFFFRVHIQLPSRT